MIIAALLRRTCVNRSYVTLFRVAAIAEACSWAGLLIGMFVKYGPADNELGVKIFGPVHGGLFLLYVLSVLLVRGSLRWSAGRTLLGLLASIPPFATIWFERTALRAAAASGAPGAPAEDRTPARL
jgi:integral membrane protein